MPAIRGWLPLMSIKNRNFLNCTNFLWDCDIFFIVVKDRPACFAYCRFIGFNECRGQVYLFIMARKHVFKYKYFQYLSLIFCTMQFIESLWLPSIYPVRTLIFWLKTLFFCLSDSFLLELCTFAVHFGEDLPCWYLLPG